ncbi:MAG: tetratricopeptide repeat protein [Gammaproteobacteria bacterium]|nr:tetratricopeptide repeat protein [Gammaproteobacteria bacterium]
MKLWFSLSLYFLAGCSGTVPVVQTSGSPQPVIAAAPGPGHDFGPAVSGGVEAELMYQLLVGEIAGHEGQYDVSVEHYLVAARLTQDPELARRATKIALYSGDDQSALKAAEYWRELEPDLLEVHQLLANLYVRVGDQPRALVELESVLALSGENPDYRALTELLGEFPDPEAAMAVMSGLLEQRSDDPVALMASAALALRAKNYPAAESALERVLSTWPDRSQAAELYVEMLVQQRRLDEARDFLLTRLAATPDQDLLRLQLARLYVETRDLPGAVAEFERLLATQPDDTRILFSLGLLNLELEELDEAEGYFNRIAEQGAGADGAHYHLGQIAEHRQQRLQAIDWYRQTYEGKYAFLARLRLAILVAEGGDFRQAVSELHLARPANPQQRITLVLTEAEILQNAEALDDAMDVLDGALQTYTEDVDLLYARAMLAGRLDRIDLLEADLRKVVEMEPDNVHALNALGYTLADRTERQQEALAYISRANALAPENPFVLDSLGWVYYRLGQNDLALEYLSKAFEIMPDNEIMAHLGEVLWAAGRQHDARALLDQGLRSSPEDPLLLEVLDRFEP